MALELIFSEMNSPQNTLKIPVSPKDIDISKDSVVIQLQTPTQDIISPEKYFYSDIFETMPVSRPLLFVEWLYSTAQHYYTTWNDPTPPSTPTPSQTNSSINP